MQNEPKGTGVGLVLYETPGEFRVELIRSFADYPGGKARELPAPFLIQLRLPGMKRAHCMQLTDELMYIYCASDHSVARAVNKHVAEQHRMSPEMLSYLLSIGSDLFMPHIRQPSQE